MDKIRHQSPALKYIEIGLLVDTLPLHCTISAPTNTTLFMAKKIVEKTPLPYSMSLLCSPHCLGGTGAERTS